MKKNLLCKYKTKKAFTLIEILVAILILSSVLILGFQLYTKALASKVKIDEQANLEKNIYYFSERLFQLIKKGGTLDYEEYWNRSIVSSTDVNPGDYNPLKNGHYEKNSGFGNFGRDGYNSSSSYDFGNGFYYCVSGNVKDGEYLKYDGKGCLISNYYKFNILNDYNKLEMQSDFSNPEAMQRYGQYSFQFIDYNSNGDDDYGDEDGNGKFIGDDDDKHLGRGPEVFGSGSDVKELYLLSGDKKTRTFFRWYIKKDEHIKDDTKKCESELTKDSNGYWRPKNPDRFQYCRGTIQFLQLEGKDWGMDHNSDYIDDDKTQNDGVVDTWVIASNFSGKNNSDSNSNNTVIAGTSEDEKYWKELFSDSINISDFKVFAYPNIDSSKVWDITPEEQKKYKISPYVILSFEVKPSWKVKAKISGGEIKPIRFNTTINLTDIFSK